MLRCTQSAQSVGWVLWLCTVVRGDARTVGVGEIDHPGGVQEEVALVPVRRQQTTGEYEQIVEEVDQHEATEQIERAEAHRQQLALRDPVSVRCHQLVRSARGE